MQAFTKNGIKSPDTLTDSDHEDNVNRWNRKPIEEQPFKATLSCVVLFTLTIYYGNLHQVPSGGKYRPQHLLIHMYMYVTLEIRVL